MTCLEFVELVTEYMERTLSEQTRRRFESHIGLCLGCGTYLGQIRQVVDQVGKLCPEDLSVDARVTLLVAFADWHIG